tara:strand:+ start:489 stop:869 length:381 start_codon:yes stop_codon:yes gene_type:complete
MDILKYYKENQIDYSAFLPILDSDDWDSNVTVNGADKISYNLAKHFADATVFNLANVAMDIMRKDRNRLLVEVVDTKARIYTNQNLEVPKSILDYRQALLDLPETASPELDSDGNLTGVTWPTIPE